MAPATDDRMHDFTAHIRAMQDPRPYALLSFLNPSDWSLRCIARSLEVAHSTSVRVGTINDSRTAYLSGQSMIEQQEDKDRRCTDSVTRQPCLRSDVLRCQNVDPFADIHGGEAGEPRAYG